VKNNKINPYVSDFYRKQMEAKSLKENSRNKGDNSTNKSTSTGRKSTSNMRGAINGI
jgi:hypothetical protein